MLFQKKSVDSVLAAFTKVVEDLRAVEEDSIVEREKQKEIANVASTNARLAQGEALRAAAVRTKLEAIIAA